MSTVVYCSTLICNGFQAKGGRTAQPVPQLPAVQPAAADSPPRIHVRRPARPAAAPPHPQLQLPFAEQDDDFVEFAKSLTRLPPGVMSCAGTQERLICTITECTITKHTCICSTRSKVRHTTANYRSSVISKRSSPPCMPCIPSLHQARIHGAAGTCHAAILCSKAT